MHPSSSYAVGASTAIQACAVCKYQRRKCSPDCVLAPFFPANNRTDFLNAHKLFGVSNITKILRGLDYHHRSLAVKSIIFQSNVRAVDPVGGCYRIICDLHREIHLVQAELNLVLAKLADCRSLYHDGVPNHHRLRQLSLEDHGNGFIDGFLPEFEASSLAPDVSDDIKPFLGGFYDKAPAAAAVPLDSNHLPYSGNGVLKEHMTSEKEKHDLKNAASLFSLTNGED